MASNSTTSTKVIVAVIAGIVLVIILLPAIYFFIKWRIGRSRQARRHSTPEVELTNSHDNPRHRNVLGDGRNGHAQPEQFHDDLARGRAILSPYTNTRDPPLPNGRSIREMQRAGAERQPSPPRQVLYHGQEISPPLTLMQQQKLRSNQPPLRHGETREIHPRTELTPELPISNTEETQYQPQQQDHTYGYHSAMSSPLTSTTVATSPSILDSPSLPASTSLLYHTHLHPTHPSIHLRAPRSSRRSRSHSSLISSILSSSASTESLTGRVNPAFLATQRARLATRPARKRRFDILGLGSEGGSSNGGGWVIRPKATEPSISIEAALAEARAREAGVEAEAQAGETGGERVPETTVTAPTPPPTLKTKKSARSMRPAAEGTPQLDTISDGPRWAPTIHGVEGSHRRDREQDLGSIGGDAGAQGGIRDSVGGPPDVYGRGSMTDQHFVRTWDRHFAVKEGQKRGAVRVDARGRIVRP